MSKRKHGSSYSWNYKEDLVHFFYEPNSDFLLFFWVIVSLDVEYKRSLEIIVTYIFKNPTSEKILQHHMNSMVELGHDLQGYAVFKKYIWV